MYRPAVDINETDIRACYDFAERAWQRESQSQKHFGGFLRSRDDFIADQTEGKLAEIALSKFLSRLGVKTLLDFQHYSGQQNTDHGDVALGVSSTTRAKVDVKSSSAKAQWLLVEDYKFFQIGTRRLASDVFVMVCFDSSFPGNKVLRRNPGILLQKRYKAFIEGWALSQDFFAPGTNEFWFEWPKGTRPYRSRVLPQSYPTSKQELMEHLKITIPRAESNEEPTVISMPLDANLNYGLPIVWLRRDWNAFVKAVTR